MEKTGGGKRRKLTHDEPLAQLTDKVEETKQQTVIIQFRNSEEEDVGFEIAVGFKFGFGFAITLIRGGRRWGGWVGGVWI